MVAVVRNSLARLKRGIQREGLFSALRSFAVRKFNRRFRARLCVWVWRHGEPLGEGSDEVEISCYRRGDELPESVLNELIAGDTETFSERMREEFSEGGVLWVGSVDEKVAGYQWSRRGDYVENWHFDLTERDVLIYSTVTFHEFRGRRVAGTVMAEICRQEVPTGGRGCADCMVWNTPSVRFIQKTGFTKVEERKPLPDHPD